MTCKPGNPSIKFIGTDGWVGNTGWRGKVQASSDEILNSVIGPDEIKLFTDPAGEHRNFLDCVKTRKPANANSDVAAQSHIVCHAAYIAWQLGRAVKFDPVKDEFLGDEEANRMRSRAMRDPWRI